ncbi:MAG: tyrosine-type recombinase/integrase, partial [Verrucomicrobia bacterium]|nr:tyrosine-type recombinase/integrase [Verrucomicrobiota bacterium]
MQHYVHTLTGKTIVDFLSWLRTCRNNGSGAINRKISTVKMYIRFLASTDIPGAADVPIQYLQRARQPYAGPVKTLEIHEVKRILAGILGYRDFALFNLLYALGLRLSEALSLDLDAIDWKKRTCTVHGKGRKQRTLYLVKPLCDILVHYRQLRSELRNAQTSNAFFLSKKGNRLSARTAEENFQKLINKVGPFTIP